MPMAPVYVVPGVAVLYRMHLLPSVPKYQISHDRVSAVRELVVAMADCGSGVLWAASI